MIPYLQHQGKRSAEKENTVSLGLKSHVHKYVKKK